jgi:hypothetical protein
LSPEPVLRDTGAALFKTYKTSLSRENVGESLSIEFLSKTLDLMFKERIILFYIGNENYLLLLLLLLCIYSYFKCNHKNRKYSINDILLITLFLIN